MENEPKISLETINAEKAKEYLSKNNKNRHLREWHIKSFENDLKEGKFLDYAETIKFDVKDHLIDGQHRLSAIANTKIPAKFIVIRNLPDEIANVIDQGAVRNVEDILAMSKDIASLKDIKYLKTKISTTKKLFNGFGVSKEDKTSNNEQAIFIKEKGDLLEEFIRIFDDAKNGMGKTAIKAAFINHALTKPDKKEFIVEIAKRLVGKSSVGLTNRDALWKFEKQHTKMTNIAKKVGGDPRTNLVYALALQAVEDQLNKKNVKLVECRFDEFTQTKYTKTEEE